ncbi:hypothetical protein nbrc107696_28620 [Gordonia spumicola]|uniref:Uncharacterized protein n=1 Tax=Gordonia spumicola TaxID=589161 RepID=A0A7I9VAL1_9ACTN|nr:hypothetical protein [Gordonia spumicola]GEE02416.1 hypothetical protein nbrc107696_28620 [Gordonia spumicola]
MARITITLPDDVDAQLRRSAADPRMRGGSAGLLARALIAYGLDHIDEPAVQEAILDVVGDDRARRQRVGKTVMEERWAEHREGVEAAKAKDQAKRARRRTPKDGE